MGGVFVIICLGIFVLFIVTVIFEMLWNSTLPELFDLPEITTWQSFKLLLLSSMLFGAGSLASFNFEM